MPSRPPGKSEDSSPASNGNPKLRLQPDPERNSIECPKCRCRDCRVARTETERFKLFGKEQLRVRRRRICRFCGYIFFTIELDEVELLSHQEG